ncbi:hypothetical protein [Aquirufa sp.]|jgi:hypothetical protein|uniref:hypothetical protein n=1 Tax=Aquirufa sp. TaxID=2676249 RepID=UPI0037BE6A76
MKITYIKFLLAFILLSGCKKKVDLAVEVFDSKTYKTSIEDAFADSPDKKDQEILLTFLNDLLDRKIYQYEKEAGVVGNPWSSLRNQFLSPSKPADLTYNKILNDYARNYSLWRTRTKSFDEKSKKSLDLKLTKFLKSEIYNDGSKDRLQFEVKNIGSVNIVSIMFNVSIENKSGEELYWGKFELDRKVPKGANSNAIIYDPEVTKVSNMDLDALKKRVIITNISFADGTTLSRPE